MVFCSVNINKLRYRVLRVGSVDLELNEIGKQGSEPNSFVEQNTPGRDHSHAWHAQWVTGRAVGMQLSEC